MVEPSTRHSAPLTVASLFASSSRDVKVNFASKNEIDGKIAPNRQNEEEGNNQEDDNPRDGDDGDSDDQKSDSSSQSSEEYERKRSGDVLQHLRIENSTLVQRMAQMEIQHAQHVDKLEVKLQQAIQTHKEIEKRLRSQLETVLQEQQAAVENARKVRSVLTRISNWMRQVQRAAQHERRPSVRDIKPVDHEFELRVTPRTDAPYTLWTGGANLATNVPECDESPTASSKFSLNEDVSQWPVPDSYGILIDSNANALPPPAPGRKRTKSLPAEGFNYVGYFTPSPCSRLDGVLHKPVGGTEFILDGLPSVSSAVRKDPPVRKRSAGSLLSYCAQVVTTSLASVRSSPSPPGKVVPAWKIDRLAPLREGLEVDEETGQCSPGPSSRRGQHLNVALPNLSIGLL